MFTLIPSSAAVLSSSDTARMARPMRVLFTSSTSAIIRTMDTQMIITDTRDTVSAPSERLPGKRFSNMTGSAPKISCAAFCRKKLIPMAVIRSEMRAECLSGLYASFSMATPRSEVKATQMSMLSQTGTFRRAIRYHTTKEATMIMSPCAKLIRRIMP